MTIRAVIVDDEQLARQELEYLLRKADDVEIVAQGKNGVEAVELVRDTSARCGFPRRADARTRRLCGAQEAARQRSQVSASRTLSLPRLSIDMRFARLK